jgi:hypothetical protein
MHPQTSQFCLQVFQLFLKVSLGLGSEFICLDFALFKLVVRSFGGVSTWKTCRDGKAARYSNVKLHGSILKNNVNPCKRGREIPIASLHPQTTPKRCNLHNLLPKIRVQRSNCSKMLAIRNHKRHLPKAASPSFTR